MIGSLKNPSIGRSYTLLGDKLLEISMASTAKLKFSNSQNIKVLSKYLPDNLGELRLSAFYVAVGRDCFVLRYNFLICLQCSLQKNSLIVGNLRHFVLSFNISNRQLVIIYATYLARNIYGAQILIYTLGTGGKGEVFMAVENVSPSFSLQPCNILATKQLFWF